jgi:hypothetical protein
MSDDISWDHANQNPGAGGNPSGCAGHHNHRDRLQTEIDQIKYRVDLIEMDEVSERNNFELLVMQLKDAFHRLLHRRK